MLTDDDKAFVDSFRDHDWSNQPPDVKDVHEFVAIIDRLENELAEARKDRDDANERALADNAEAVRARAERDEARAQLTDEAQSSTCSCGKTTRFGARSSG